MIEGGYTWGPSSTLSAKGLDSTDVKKLLGSDSPYLHRQLCQSKHLKSRQLYAAVLLSCHGRAWLSGITAEPAAGLDKLRVQDCSLH